MQQNADSMSDQSVNQLALLSAPIGFHNFSAA